MSIYIVGPTSSGKTALAVHIASLFNCEIISADSRQIYKGMDIGTGKDLKEYGDIKYHCIDLINPKTEYSLAKYLKQAKKAIKEIENKGKIPLIVGGTGLYIDALIKGYNISNDAIDNELRKELLELTKEELQQRLLKLNNKAKEELNNSDWNNPCRLIRQIEKIACRCHRSATPCNNSFATPNNNSDNIVIGISVDKNLLHDRIYKRIINRIKNEGMIEEIYNLHYKNKVSWKRLESFGLEYKFISQYLQKLKLEPVSYNNLSPTLEQIINNLSTATNQYAKRQITWFNKTPGLIWLDGNNKEKLYKETEKLVKNFLNK